MTRMTQPRTRESALNSSRGGRQEPTDALGADTPVRLRWTEADMEFKGDAVMLMIMLVCPYYNPEFSIARPSLYSAADVIIIIMQIHPLSLPLTRSDHAT